MDSSLRYFGWVVGFGFGVLWMTEGLGAAILCLLLGAVGYGVVFVAERARANPDSFRPKMPMRTRAAGIDLPRRGRRAQHPPRSRPPAVRRLSSPLAAEADYGWPVEQQELGRTKGR